MIQIIKGNQAMPITSHVDKTKNLIIYIKIMGSFKGKNLLAI